MRGNWCPGMESNPCLEAISFKSKDRSARTQLVSARSPPPKRGSMRRSMGKPSHRPCRGSGRYFRRERKTQGTKGARKILQTFRVSFSARARDWLIVPALFSGATPTPQLRSRPVRRRTAAAKLSPMAKTKTPIAALTEAERAAVASLIRERNVLADHAPLKSALPSWRLQTARRRRPASP
jgi:hypothetical protein